jgi:hypothetical protein
MTIRRNKNGQQNLADLRAALAERDDVTVYALGGNWIISNYSHPYRVWQNHQCPYWYTERQAIQHALFGQCETETEEAYHATPSA